MEAIGDYLSLCKPKVVALMLLTSLVGMQLASPEVLSLYVVFFATLGIALSSGSAAVFNHLIDRKLDAKMQRTAMRPIASGRISPQNALIFALSLGALGIGILLKYVNALVAGLTFSTVIGYALFYTVWLKRATPQNIVIGGLAGAMPPLLGWVSVSGEITGYALLPVLIIFIWTPPHFWPLAIYRCAEYENANIPMLPVTHGIMYTKVAILLYSLLLLITSLLPYITGMSTWIYLTAALILGLAFFLQTLVLYLSTEKKMALRTFNVSIFYLLLLFLALMVDHHMQY